MTALPVSRAVSAWGRKQFRIREENEVATYTISFTMLMMPAWFLPFFLPVATMLLSPGHALGGSVEISKQRYTAITLDSFLEASLILGEKMKHSTSQVPTVGASKDLSVQMERAQEAGDQSGRRPSRNCAHGGCCTGDLR